MVVGKEVRVLSAGMVLARAPSVCNTAASSNKNCIPLNPKSSLVRRDTPGNGYFFGATTAINRTQQNLCIDTIRQIRYPSKDSLN